MSLITHVVASTFIVVHIPSTIVIVEVGVVPECVVLVDRLVATIQLIDPLRVHHVRHVLAIEVLFSIIVASVLILWLLEYLLRLRWVLFDIVILRQVLLSKPTGWKLLVHVHGVVDV